MKLNIRGLLGVLLIISIVIGSSLYTLNKPNQKQILPTEIKEVDTPKISVKYNTEQQISKDNKTMILKLTNTETVDVPINKTQKIRYFKTFYTATNKSQVNITLNDLPVAGLTKDDYLVFAKNISTEIVLPNVGDTNGVKPPTVPNFMNPEIIIKPGETVNGYFIFEKEIKNVQFTLNNTNYIWATSKDGTLINGTTYTNETQTIFQNLSEKTDKIATFSFVESKIIISGSATYKYVVFTIHNYSSENINPAIYLPKFGVTTPGDIVTRTLPDINTNLDINGTPLTEAAFITPNEEASYYYSFPETTKYLQLQPPTENIDSFVRISI